MQPGFFCNSGASLLSSLLTTTTLWGSLCSSLLTTTLWCCLSSSFLTTLCSHVDFLSEWFDPSPNLFKANRDSICGNFPLFWRKSAPACRNSFFKKSVLWNFFRVENPYFLRVKSAKTAFSWFLTQISVITLPEGNKKYF